MRRLLVALAILLSTAAGLATADDPFKDLAQSDMTGTVRDADGKPINGAKVHLNNAQGPYATRGGNWAFTGADGKYTLRVFVKPDSKVVVTEVIVSAKGFVQLRERCLLEEVVLLPGKKTEAHFTLARGEVLSGKIDVPLHGAENAVGVKPEERQFAFVVRGPSFKEYFLTDKGGRFEVWVPKGTYTIKEVGMAGSRRPPVRREKVPSGSADLKLARIYPRPGAEALGKTFDALWDDMDRNYSHFTLKKIDWKALKDRYRPRAVAAGDLCEFVEVLTEMLGHLRDGHVWIDFEGHIPTYVSRADGNYNRKAVSNALKEPTYCGNFAFVGVTKADSFGVVVLTNQSRADKDSVSMVVEFIRAHHAAPGFLVDLRETNGGNELLAREIAREFCNKDAVYAKSKYRAGPGHDDFGPVYARVLKAGDKPYTKPVVCLIGPRAVSSGEGFVQMLKCLPHVTTVGGRTRGSSGNPKPFELPGGAVTIWYSRWVDLMPDGTPIEGVGITPDVAVAAPQSAYEKKDPTWDKAVEVLRRRASAGRR
jgi:Peptidase family S41/Tricorn protease C1 domain/Carboxypeptidase regulatory-like domain